MKKATDRREFLKGKKILITSYSYALLGGAELNAVELAEQLVQFGAEPHFFSYDIDGPLTQYINKTFKTKVLTDAINNLAETEDGLGYTRLNIEDYDYIWVGANIVPISIIKQINTAKRLPKFVFIHMSQLPGYPLDAPLLPEFEKKIASRILSISDKATTDCVYRILGKDIPLDRWYNPAPREFRLLKKRSGQLRRIAVISSSYPTDEVMGIKEDIERRGMQIDYIGRFNFNAQLVDAKLYDKYDLIIGIGKNAKYSLVSGVPIYVYGRFGGGGYLNEKNYAKNDGHNFSGRGFGRKTSGQIVQEIVDGYADALKFHEDHRDEFIQEFSLDVVAERLFTELEKERSKKVQFSEEYINWLVSMQLTLNKLMKLSGLARARDARRGELESLLAARNEEIAQILNSKSWRVTRPLRSVSSALSKIRRQHP